MTLRRDKSEQLRMPGDLYGRLSSRRKHDFASYIWLVYSSFFFIQPILVNRRAYWLHQAGYYAIFLALYVAYVQFEKQRIRLGLIAGIYLLGVVLMPTNVGSTCFYIYVAAMLPFCVESGWILWSVIGVELLTLGLEYKHDPEDVFNYLIAMLFVLVVGGSNAFVAQGKRADQKLQQAQLENVELAAVAERERIARDLHDVLGHTLSVIVLKAELAGRLMGRDDVRAAAEIADVERTARTALAEVREAIGGYRAKGLQAEVDMARMTLDAAGVTLDCESRPPTLKAREETVLSLAVREAVTNIVRHAHATRCTMRFGTTNDGFAALEVEDDGEARIEREGNGLRGMRERVQQLGGRFRIEAAPRTKLVIELPQV